MTEKLRRLLSLYGAPLYILLSMSWLFAPGLHEQGALQLISRYEAFGQPYSVVFRSFDLAASVLLALGAWYLIGRTHKLYRILLLAIAVLSMIDAIFASSSASSGWQSVSASIHGVESTISVGAVAFLAVVDIFKRRSTITIWFVVLQLTCAAIALFSLNERSILTFLQYIYQISTVSWLAWMMQSFVAKPRMSDTLRRQLVQLFGYLTASFGVLFILAAILPIQHAGRFFHGFEHDYSFIGQNSVIAGVVMLYLARHVAQGQRRAALVIGGLLGLQLVMYSIVRPSPSLLLLSLLAYGLLWYSYPAFSRNIKPLKLGERLADIAIVVAGISVAIGLFFAVVQLTGRQAQVDRVFDRAENTRPARNIRHHLPHHDIDIEPHARHLRRVVGSLTVATILIILWSLFRPASFAARKSDADEQAKVRAILDRFSTSSEDYFKLWPEDKQYFFNKAETAFIAYKVSGSIAFALADPVGSPQSRKSLIKAFRTHCHEYGLSVCFLMVNEASKTTYQPDFKIMKIGSSAVIDVQQFADATVRSKWWRWQANRSRKAGCTYEYSEVPHTASLLTETADLSDHWMQRAGHSEQSFALGYYDIDYLQQCNLHLLRDSQGALIAFANQLPTFHDNKQATVDLIRFNPETDGAMPTLIMHLILRLAETGRWDRFDLGFVPLAKVDTPIARLARTLGSSRFSAAGLEQFKGKFKPDWQPNYVAYEGDIIELGTMIAQLENVLKLPRV
jgi:lysylphosphatidylglycerol synthetase-like protein (DUF2156 family)